MIAVASIALMGTFAVIITWMTFRYARDKRELITRSKAKELENRMNRLENRFDNDFR